MIGFLKGTIHTANLGNIILVVQGVGYKVTVSKDTGTRIRSGAESSLFTHLAVRETALDLYGFETESDLRFFELLLTVSGIGPKSALAILDLAPVETLRSAIAQGNPAYLTSISGIGKKTAEKVVLELKDKVGPASQELSSNHDEEALEAMRALGYSTAEARDALKNVPQDLTNIKDRIRHALKQTGKK